NEPGVRFDSKREPRSYQTAFRTVFLTAQVFDQNIHWRVVDLVDDPVTFEATSESRFIAKLILSAIRYSLNTLIDAFTDTTHPPEAWLRETSSSSTPADLFVNPID